MKVIKVPSIDNYKVIDVREPNYEWYKKRFPKIKSIHQNESKRTTVVILKDGRKGIVKVCEGDDWNSELGVMHAYVKACEAKKIPSLSMVMQTESCNGVSGFSSGGIIDSGYEMHYTTEHNFTETIQQMDLSGRKATYTLATIERLY